MEDKIICLVGASGSGKTTIAKELEKEGYNIIHSYTTRKRREPNEWGHSFIKKGDGMYEAFKTGILLLTDALIAYKQLYGEHYFATKKQYQGKGTSIHVVCPDGARQVKENVKDAEVVTIYLQVDEDTRNKRLHQRYEHLDTSVSIYKVNNRLKEDKQIFKVIKCDYVIDGNRLVEEVLEDVKCLIE